jgi:tetratricopeptide (TPR) repeat protein
LKGLAAGLAVPPFAAQACEAVLEQVLAAHRTGTLEQLLRRRPRAARWFMRRFVAPVLAASGGEFGDDRAEASAVRVLLTWGLGQLRPDGTALRAPIPREAWLELTAWRPLLALACHYGFLPAQAFTDRYQARADESAADRLCGLWDIGPSTFYRYLDKGRRQLADVLLDRPMPSDRMLSLYAWARDEAHERLRQQGSTAPAIWHARQVDAALEKGDACTALWHQLHAQDPAGVVALLLRSRHALAATPHTDALLRLLPLAALDERTQVRLMLAKAALARTRGASEQERRACEHALRIAAAEDDKLMLGIVYGALGKFHETRDIDRAFAFFHESAAFLDQAGASAGCGVEQAGVDPDAAAAYLSTLVHLAWLYTLRNDSRAKAVLDKIEVLRTASPPPDEVEAMANQAWGEYWRRSGDLRRALEAKHRALQIYERTDNLPQILRASGNLALLYGQTQQYELAVEYSQRVLTMAETTPVDPETVASTHINLGVVYVWQHRFDEAIEHYHLAAERARAARLRIVAGRAHYNLAEAYYLRLQRFGQPDDERLGDGHVSAALAAWPEDGEASAVEATRKLKQEILGQTHDACDDKLLPDEFAVHLNELQEVRRRRRELALPQSGEKRIEAQLAIAAAYVAIAVQEREAAVALVAQHGLHEHHDAALQALRDAFDRGLAREQRLADQWGRQASDLLADGLCATVLRHLVDSGSITKSIYAQLCGVAPSTASRHLGQLAERGLLAQNGRGSRTRYALVS